MTYAFGGFSGGQVVHADVVRSMVWLPLELALAVRMADAEGRTRLRIAALGGAVFGIQGLAFHVHVTLLSGLAVSGFVLYKWLRRTHRLREGAELAGCLALMTLLGAGLAAVQLLPLRELST